MSTKITRANALRYATDSLRIEGLAVDATGQTMLAQLVEGKVSAAELKRSILTAARAPESVRTAPVTRRAALAR